MGYALKFSYDNCYIEEDRGYKTPCWVWQHYITPNGYGQRTVNGSSVKAHRDCYETWKNKKLPKHIKLDHLCRIRCCVNPEHLEEVSNKINSRRGIKVKLTERDAMEILDLQKVYTHSTLAVLYDVSKSAISMLCCEKNWR